MLLKSKRRTAPRSDASRAAFARRKRYWRSRSVLTRSSQSTVCAPGEANGRDIADPRGGGARGGAAAEARVRREGGPASPPAFNDATRARALARPVPTTTMASVDDPRGGSVARPAARSSPGSAPEYAVIGDHLGQVRQDRGLSLRALAARVGVSPSLISQVETGRARPSVRTLYAMASELRISLDELL